MIQKTINDFFQNKENISISQAQAINKSVIGLVLFDPPLVGYSSSNDPLYQQFKEDYTITYGKFMPPIEWLKTAKTVVSIFLPFSLDVVDSNGLDPKVPSAHWLHGRCEGQEIINHLTRVLLESISQEGFSCVAPSLDERFSASVGTNEKGKSDNSEFSSNWSERHVAYVSGLGTFGLSRGLITEKGIAGRFTSIVTNLEIAPTHRKYSSIYDYCKMCGKCISSCPVNAISQEGKEHSPCRKYLGAMAKSHFPRYGCGKCQVHLPCSRSIP